MTNCERCYHNKVCINGANHKNAESCIHFKDKDQIVELPCKELCEKIGSCMYCITEETNKVVEVIVGIIEFNVEGQGQIITHAIDYDYETDDETCSEIDFCFTDIGKTLFFTYKEAKAVLEERENNDT